MAIYDSKFITGARLKYFYTKLAGKFATIVNLTAATDRITAIEGMEDTWNGKQNAITDGSAVVATVADDVVTLKAGVAQTNGAVAQAAGDDIVLNKVAKTGAASDLTQDASNRLVTDVEKAAWDAKQTAQQVQDAINSSIAGLTGFHFVVPEDSKLPTSDIDVNAIYLILKSSGPEGNIYSEYAYINSKWEMLGDTAMDLDVITNAEIDAIVDGTEE